MTARERARNDNGAKRTTRGPVQTMGGLSQIRRALRTRINPLAKPFRPSLAFLPAFLLSIFYA